jgi:uncharacterized membrane protein
MKEKGSILLNVVGSLTALLIVVNVIFIQYNKKIGTEIQAAQADMNRVGQLNNVASNLILKIANISREDSQLKELLAKHNMQVTFKDKKQ